MTEENLDSLYSDVENILKEVRTSFKKFEVVDEKFHRGEITLEEWVGFFAALLGKIMALTAKVAELSLALKIKIDAITKQ